MKAAFKTIGILLAATLLSACVYHPGNSRPYSNSGYYPGNGNSGYRNNYPYRNQPNQPRPPAYGYWRNQGSRPARPDYRYQGNNYYYNRPQPYPGPRQGYSYPPQPRYERHDRHDHDSHWENRQNPYVAPRNYPQQPPRPSYQGYGIGHSHHHDDHRYGRGGHDRD